MRENKKNINGGYTLIEMIVTVAVLLIIIGSGLMSFYRTLRGGIRTDLTSLLDSNARATMNSLTFLLKQSQIETLDGADKNDCLAAGVVGLTGESLLITTFDGDDTTLSLDGDRVASVSASQSKTVLVSSDSLQVSDLSFDWKCGSGQRDVVSVVLTAVAIEISGETSISKTYNFSVPLISSGYY